MKILLAEDDKKLARFLARLLTEEGYTVDSCARGQDALTQAQAGVYDLLVLDRGVLEAAAWTGLAETGAVVEIRRGDPEDPLAGVVRVSRQGEAPVDVVVGRRPFLEGVLSRRARLDVRGRVVPVVLGADLVVLKVFAGGPQDLLDAETLLAGDEDGRLRAELESRLPELPTGLRREVSAILERRPG